MKRNERLLSKGMFLTQLNKKIGSEKKWEVTR